MNLQRYIEAPREVRQRVAKELGISEGTVSLALSFERNGEQSRKARELVLASGEARLMNYLPECETIHVQSKRMRQVFANGNILVVELETGRYRLYSAGEEVEGKERMSGVLDTIPSLMQVQCIAEDYNL